MTHPEIAHAHVTKISLLVKYREGAESEVLILSRQITFIHYCYCLVIIAQAATASPIDCHVIVLQKQISGWTGS